MKKNDVVNNLLWTVPMRARDLGIEIPDWIDQEIDIQTMLAIEYGGCDSGSYMPAVTYATAVATMAQHGDYVVDHVRQFLDDDASWQALTNKNRLFSNDYGWSQICVSFLSQAVELWATSELDVIRETVEELISDVELDDRFQIKGPKGPVAEPHTDADWARWVLLRYGGVGQWYSWDPQPPIGRERAAYLDALGIDKYAPFMRLAHFLAEIQGWKTSSFARAMSVIYMPNPHDPRADDRRVLANK